MISFLLTYRTDWTDANPWFGFAGLAATLIVGCCLDGLIK